MEGYLTLKEASKKLRLSDRRLNTLCLEGRIDGASKVGNTWVVPDTISVPKDKRIKSGKYIKNTLDKKGELAK